MVMSKLFRPLKIAFVSTYLPRQCGIATFTNDLLNSMKLVYGSDNNEDHEGLQVIALNNIPRGYTYNQDVTFTIRDQYREDYRRAADFINLSPVDLVSIQHEFGIFGGEDGNYLINLLGALKKPVVTTLHTVLQEPTPGQRKTLSRICNQSTLVVVQARKAIQLLTDIYGVPEDKIRMIHHGAPDVPFLDPSYYKEQLQAEGRKVVLTFGLLSPNKGIEYAIEALAEVARKFPEVLYIVLGATHSEIKRRHGEQYRHSLKKMVADKGLSEHVVFYNQYVTLERLVQFLVATDIYITPYVNKEQIVSGTLAYAMACGKAIVSTPYWYAKELLEEERGLLVPFRDSRAIAEALTLLLRDEVLRNRMRKQCYQFGRQMIWREVAHAYAGVFEEALQEYGERLAYSIQLSVETEQVTSLPEVKLDHLQILTDSTGLLQHAAFFTPDRWHGYCTDDNARALLMSVMNWQLYKDESIMPFLHRYLGFLNYALDPEKGQVRNFMSYSRQWLEETGSEDSHGRTLWVLGYTVAYPPNEAVLGLATRLFKQGVAASFSFTSPRAWAYSVVGAMYYLKHFGGDIEVQKVLSDLSNRLFKLFKENASTDWFWGEDIVTYDNARLPQALIAAGYYLGDEEMLSCGLRALEWLLSIQTNPITGNLSLVGNRGWYTRGGEKARFDQQPLEVTAIIDACYQAYLATEETCWFTMMEWAFNWFFGNNDLHETIYNFSTGGCYDGLQPGGLNQNQGGESTISFLLALHQMHLVVDQKVLYQLKDKAEPEKV